jgi:hypothetical protein
MKKTILIVMVFAMGNLRGVCGPNGASQVAKPPSSSISYNRPNPAAFEAWLAQQQDEKLED